MRLLAIVFALGASSSTSADDEAMSPIFIPAACEQYWTIPGGMDSPVAWNQVFSFAACIQDAHLVRVDDASDLPEILEELDAEMMPSLQLYAAALQDGPDVVKLQAAYHVGMSQVALLTRLRRSVAGSPELRAELEPLLEDTARLAFKSFEMVEIVAARDPSLVSDPVTRAMVRSSHELGDALAVAWSFEGTDTVIAR